MVQTSRLNTNTEQRQSDQAKMEQDTSKKIGGKVKPSYKHIPHSQKPPHLVAKRNARERRRVQAVNQAFYKLRKSVPIENRNKRVSKVKTLQRAIDYIRRLERILAEDDEAQTGAAAASAAAANGNQLVSRSQQLAENQVSNFKLHQETQPLQQTNCNQLNSSSSARNEVEKNMSTSRGSNNDSGQLKSSQAKKKPQSLAGKRVQKPNNSTTAELEAAGHRGQTRGRKPQPADKSKQPADEFHEADQVARAQQKHAQCVAGPLQQEDNNYATTSLKSANGGGDSASGVMTPGQCCATTSAVSYGKPHDSTTTTTMTANRLAGVPQPQPPPSNHHYLNHHYQYYTDSPTSSTMMSGNGMEQSDQFVYNNNHLQLASNQIQNSSGQQLRTCLSGEISSSSMMTNAPSLCGNYLPASYHYAASPMDQTSHCQLEAANSSQHYQRLVNHNDSYSKPVDSPTTTTTTSSHQQRYYPPPLARQYQTPPQNTWNLQQESSGRESEETVDNCSKKAHAKMAASLKLSGQQEADKEQVGELTSSEGQHRKQAEYERLGGPISVMAALSMPADSTSCSAQKDSTNRPSALNGIRSPPVSNCSSSSLSPSTTTLKTLDLSGNSSGSSAIGTMFGSSNINRSDKSPTTSAPVVGRQPNKSSLENGAHSTTASDYVQQQQQSAECTNRREQQQQQQVNNCAGQLPTYAAHLSYEAQSSDSNANDYLRSGGGGHQLLRPPPPLPTDEQRAIQTKLTGSVQRNGSRSSSAISPDLTTTQPQPLAALVGGNYLANNNLHGTDQHHSSAPLFQYHPAAYYNQQHLHHNHNHHHHHNQQSFYQQGQHFFGNHQQHNTNHLSDHHHHHNNHHHHQLQSDSADQSSELRQQNANTIELVTTTNINGHHQQLERLMSNNTSATITTAAPAQFTALPL